MLSVSVTRGVSSRRHSSDFTGAGGMRLGTRSCTECRKRKIRCIYESGSKTCKSCAQRMLRCQPQVRTAPPHAVRNESLFPKPRKDTPDENTLSHSRDGVAGINAGAPLVRLMKNAEMLQTLSDDMPETQMNSLQEQDQIHDDFFSGLPHPDDILMTLTLSRRYWPLWSICPDGLKGIVENDSFGDVFEVKDILMASVRNKSPSVAAKVYYWLALCSYQLPRTTRFPLSPDSCTPYSRALSLISSGDQILAKQRLETVDSVDCLMLKASLMIKLGRPQRAWMAARRALDICLLLRLDSKNNIDLKTFSTWFQAWQTDQSLSIILGVPPKIPDWHVNFSVNGRELGLFGEISFRLSLVTGHINERNLLDKGDDVVTLQNLVAELEQSRNLIPDDWWDFSMIHSLSFKELYVRQCIKMLYSKALRLLHEPAMLKALYDSAFDTSFKAALAASRMLISEYMRLRDFGSGGVVICDIMDFQAFSAGLTLYIALISPAYTRNAGHEQHDWDLLASLKEVLGQVADSLDCHVAGQASHILDMLLRAAHGELQGMETLNVKIPYFGHIAIRLPRDKWQTPGSLGSSLSDAKSVVNEGEITDFDVSSHELAWSLYPTTFSMEELGCDWNIASDIPLDYNWDHIISITPHDG